MKLSLHLIAAAAFLFMGAQGRKKLVNAKNQRVATPKVYDCEPVCVFEGEVDSWCFEWRTPHFQMGWEWTQTFSETDDDEPLNYYEAEWKPYILAGFDVKSLFWTERFYDHEIEVDLADFKFNLFISGIVNGKF